MDKKIGFIGCGNMGKAILGGLIASGQALPGQIWVYNIFFVLVEYLFYFFFLFY